MKNLAIILVFLLSITCYSQPYGVNNTNDSDIEDDDPISEEVSINSMLLSGLLIAAGILLTYKTFNNESYNSGR